MTSDEIEAVRAEMLGKMAAAGRTEKQYVDAARYAHRKALAWVADDSTAEGSFRWACDVLDLDPGAVRRALKRKPKTTD